MKYVIIFSLLVCMGMQSCNIAQKKQTDALPVLGKINAEFTFVNQDSVAVTEKTVKHKVYVTDFLPPAQQFVQK